MMYWRVVLLQLRSSMKHPLTIYAMTGPMGSGKTTLALEIAQKKSASFYSLDKTIKDFDVPINDIEDYEFHMIKALEMIRTKAIESLNIDKSVVFDFGGGMFHWNWLKGIADATGAWIEIYKFHVPLELRLARVKKRNLEKPKDVYHWIMSERVVMESPSSTETPPESERVKVIIVGK